MLCPVGYLCVHDAVPPTCIHFDMALITVFQYVYFEHKSCDWLTQLNDLWGGAKHVTSFR